MDPFSIGAGTAGFTSLGLQIYKGLLEYYSSWQSLEDDIHIFYAKTKGLTKILTVLNKAVQDPGLQQDAVTVIQDQMRLCKANLQKLDKIFGKVKAGNVQGSSIIDKAKAKGRRACHPFRESTIAKLNENVSEILEVLQMAVKVLQLDTTLTQTNVIESVASGVADLADEARAAAIFGWLAPPDPSSNHHAACKKKQPATGSWLLDDKRFSSWKAEPSSLLWLNGIPGSGKTILCSTVIKDFLAISRQTSGVAIAYFYFTFNDPVLQLCEPAVRSIIRQLSSYEKMLPKELDNLYVQCRNGQQQPSLDSLKRILRSLIGRSRHSYIVLDALDECIERSEVLDLIKELIQSNLGPLHIYVTGRSEKDIVDRLEELNLTQISLLSESVDTDIQTLLKATLQSDPKPRKWPQDVRDTIEQTLTSESNGM